MGDQEHRWYKVVKGNSFVAGQRYATKAALIWGDQPAPRYPWDPLRVIGDERFQANLRWLGRKVNLGVAEYDRFCEGPMVVKEREGYYV